MVALLSLAPPQNKRQLLGSLQVLLGTRMIQNLKWRQLKVELVQLLRRKPHPFWTLPQVTNPIPLKLQLQTLEPQKLLPKPHPLNLPTRTVPLELREAAREEGGGVGEAGEGPCGPLYPL